MKFENFETKQTMPITTEKFYDLWVATASHNEKAFYLAIGKSERGAKKSLGEALWDYYHTLTTNSDKIPELSKKRKQVLDACLVVNKPSIDKMDSE